METQKYQNKSRSTPNTLGESMILKMTKVGTPINIDPV
jgi:hypothetical protein